MALFKKDEPAMPEIVDRGAFQSELDKMRVREKAHTREGDAIAAARSRLPMVEVHCTIQLAGGQEKWEKSPYSWPQGDILDTLREDGRPRAQWSRIKAGFSIDLGSGGR